MINWSRVSERYLVNHLYKVRQNGESDSEAFNELKQRLERYFEKKVADKTWDILRSFRDDILNITIWRLIASHHTFHGNSWQFRKFIGTTLRNVCIDYLRKKFLETDSLDDGVSSPDVNEEIVRTEALTIAHITVDWAESHDVFQLKLPEINLLDQELRQETQQLLQEALSSLDNDCCQLLYLEYSEGKLQHEIAFELGLSHANVRKRLKNCREELRRLFFTILLHTEIENQRALDFPVSFLQLPEKERLVIQTWWDGETRWQRLGQLFTPPLSQKEVKILFATGLERLFHILLSTPSK